MSYPKHSKQSYSDWKKEMVEAREQEMSFMLPNFVTNCEGTWVHSKPIVIKERG